MSVEPGHGLGRLAVAAGLVVAAMLFSGQPAAAQNGQAALVRVDEVREVPLAQTVPVIGRLVPRQAGNVSARIDAPVEEYRVEIGDRVRKGDVIAILNSDIFEARFSQAEAARLQAEALLSTRLAELALARLALDRQEGLKKSSAFSQARYEDAVQQVEIARAQVEEAKSAIEAAEADQDLAKLQLQYTQVVAPYDGVVTQRQSEAGSYARVGEPLVELLSFTNLEIEVGVPFKRVSGLQPGQELAFELADDTEYEARIRAILPEENPLTRTRRVRLEPQFAEGQKNLAAGQSATVMVPVGEAREVLSVHKDAIVQRRSGDIVFVVEDGKANARPVRLGESVGGRFEVLDGLEAGESVVVRGNERLRDGQAVTIDTSGELEPVTERGGDGAASDTSGSHVTPRDPKAS